MQHCATLEFGQFRQRLIDQRVEVYGQDIQVWPSIRLGIFTYHRKDKRAPRIQRLEDFWLGGVEEGVLDVPHILVFDAEEFLVILNVS